MAGAFETGEAYLAALQALLGDTIVSQHAHRGDMTLVVQTSAVADCLEKLAAAPGLQLDVLTDLTAVDYLPRTPRFEVVYHLLNFGTSLRLRIKVQVDDGEAVPTVSNLFLSANWMEREVYDMYGIVFDGHPDLRRILLYPEFEGHPLRKDYAKEAAQPRLELRDHRPWRDTPPEGVG